MVCQICGNYSKTKSEIKKHYQKDHITFFIPNCRYLDFKPLLENTKPTSVKCSSDRPKALIRNIDPSPYAEFRHCIKLMWKTIVFFSYSLNFILPESTNHFLYVYNLFH